jgi:hypothetical protein
LRLLRLAIPSLTHVIADERAGQRANARTDQRAFAGLTVHLIADNGPSACSESSADHRALLYRRGLASREHNQARRHDRRHD